jgi:hypothetical protein
VTIIPLAPIRESTCGIVSVGGTGVGQLKLCIDLPARTASPDRRRSPPTPVGWCSGSSTWARRNPSPGPRIDAEIKQARRPPFTRVKMVAKLAAANVSRCPWCGVGAVNPVRMSNQVDGHASSDSDRWTTAVEGQVLKQGTRPKKTGARRINRCSVGTINANLASAMTALVSAQARADEDPEAFRKSFAVALETAHRVARSDRIRLHGAASPKEKWAATISMALHGLCLSHLMAEEATRRWRASGPREPVDRFIGSIARISDWLTTQGVVVAAHVAARRGAEIDELDQIHALQAALDLCPPHPSRARRSTSRHEKIEAAKEELAIVAEAMECIDDLKPDNKQLRRHLSTELDKRREEALLTRARSPRKRSLLRAIGSALEDAALASGSTEDLKTEDVRDTSPDAIEAVEVADLARLCDELRSECASKGPSSSAALEYIVRMSEASTAPVSRKSAVSREQRVSREAVAAKFGITSKALRYAERFVHDRIRQLRQRVG